MVVKWPGGLTKTAGSPRGHAGFVESCCGPSCPVADWNESIGHVAAGRGRWVDEWHARVPAGAQHRDQRRRRDRLHLVIGSRSGGARRVAGRRPAQEVSAVHEPRFTVAEHEGAVGELVERGGAEAPVAPREPLALEPLVDLVGTARADELEEAVVVLAATQRARPVAGGERGHLVEEEQLGEPA